MKQIIEIEVPDDKKAVWNNGKIEFVDVDVLELLKNSKNPEKDLMDIIAKEVEEIEDGDNILGDLYNEYMDSPDDSHLESIAKLKLFLAYLNGDHKFDLISGNVYYPYVRFYLNSKLLENEKVISHFKCKGNIFALVSGCSNYGSVAGLATFYSNYGVGFSLSSCGFLACKDSKTAQFVATTFGKLLFDVNFGSLIEYEWLD